MSHHIPMPYHDTRGTYRGTGVSGYICVIEFFFRKGTRIAKFWPLCHCLMDGAAAGIEIIQYNFLLETFGMALLNAIPVPQNS